MLIVGLGNPGKKYEGTRHNAGHMVIDQLKQQNLDGFILTKTDSFMNLSGQSVRKLISNSKFLISNLIIVHDDIDLPIGTFKIQRDRGAAGHKGVQSIIDELKNNDFWRIRVGICPESGKPKNVEKFVLQKFTKEEREILKKLISEISTVISDFQFNL